MFGLSVAVISLKYFFASRLVQAFMLGLGFSVVAAIAQIVFHLPDKNNQHRGLGPDCSTLSAYLIVGMMMAVFFLTRERRAKVKMALIGLISLYFFHFVILQSRASYVALILLVPFIGYTVLKTKKVLKTVFICLLTPCLMMLSPVVRDRLATTAEQFRSHLYSDSDAGWGKKYLAKEERLYMWHGAMRLIGKYPLLGAGTGGYQSALKAMDNDPDVPLMAHRHNNFLYMAASFGMVVLAVFLVMVATGLFNTQILNTGTIFLLSLSIGLQQVFAERSASRIRLPGHLFPWPSLPEMRRIESPRA